MKVKIQAN